MAMNAPMQPNYPRGYPQTAQRSPATPRRGGPVPGPGMPMPHQQMAHPQYMAAAAAAAAHQRNVPPVNDAQIRRSRKPTDKNMPDGVEDYVIGDGVQEYKKLRDLEKRLDSSMVRKRLDIQDSLGRAVKRYKTLRVWISNTAEGQVWQKGEQNGNGGPGSGRYKVRIEGRLLDDDSIDVTVPREDSDDEEEKEVAGGDGDDAEKSKSKTPQRSRQKLSHFFKSITIDFDRTHNAKSEDLAPITWTKPQIPPTAVSLPPTADFDTLQFSRAAQENVNITLTLVRDETPERFKVSKELQEIIDVEEDTKSGILLGIWDYIRTMKLQEDQEKRQIHCDARLRMIFGRDAVFFPQIPDAIAAHTAPLDPIKLPYTIRVDQEYHNDPTPTVYDIRVAVDDPLYQKMVALTTNPQYGATLRQIGNLDDQLALIIQAIQHSKARHSFYTALSRDPANFLRRWLSSQRRDLETILGEAVRGGGEDGAGPEFRRGGANSAWNAPVAREAVRYMLARPENNNMYR
ncbi:SWI-SNF complex subunit (BAF60b), putative [Talaromyces stipitatus ATCC 10500]|uniref:SWI-SNF complex subunit (BAF60b), putative n=1 Tax=Talaromyces stipitatus (strain ATCC 10500 / CBS 375.48 / QM 6759 / NRRL 1006) TaxID=441959 RepID=B8M6N2_TALSN|nr:SWI-SNF complex subunit (BAF60b), putative [Talaromyces stipitatus ATCC 10500]EED19494.1 SWI-SNF complex subunit (BAF60b), putative [Talaromyces stipitatus ATCC 10500]